MALCDRELNFDLTPEQGSPGGQQKDKHARSKSLAEINQNKDGGSFSEEIDRFGRGGESGQRQHIDR